MLNVRSSLRERCFVMTSPSAYLSRGSHIVIQIARLVPLLLRGKSPVAYLLSDDVGIVAGFYLEGAVICPEVD